MSYNSPIQAISSNTLTFANPSNVSTSPPALSVQIQNNSPYTLTNNFNSTIIQPSSLLTIPISLGQGPLILTVINYTAPVGVLGCQWLENGENPAQPDGPVTTNPVPAPFSVLASGDASIVIVNPSPLARGLLILNNGGNGGVAIVSISLQFSLGNDVQLGSLASGTNGYVWIPLTGAGGPLISDTNSVSVQIVFQTACNYIVYEVDSEIPPLPSLSVVEAVTVPEPAAGDDWTFTLQVPARLVGLQANLSLANVGAPRGVPQLSLYSSAGDSISVPLTTALQAIDTLEVYYASVAATGGPISTPTGVSPARWYAALPSILLPAGAVISSGSLGGLNALDQWSSIVLWFATT